MANLTTDSVDSVKSRILGLFAKAWEPGKVKTRLAKTLGNQAAAKIYRELLCLHLARFHNFPDRKIVYSPPTDETKARFETLLQQMKPRLPSLNWGLVPQVNSDLGTRMSQFFQQQFDASDASDGAAKVVVIGSDAPRLTTEIVEQAFERLESHDVVFGPSTDGGYYLVGLSVMVEEIFQGVEWSTAKVLEQSLAICKSANLSVAQLETLSDIDNEEDLRAELSLLKDSSDVLIEQVLLPNVAEILTRNKL